MIVKKVELRNVTSYEEGTVEFERGMNAIVGANGSGKSTIVDALLIATIGTCTRGEEVMRGPLSEVIRAGQSRGSIRVLLEIGGREYELVRELSREGSSRSTTLLLEDGKRVAEGSEVCSRLKQLLGIGNMTVLAYTMISRQGHLADIVELTPAKRKEVVLELAGLERLEALRENLREELKELEFAVRSAEEKEKGLPQLRERRERERRRLEEEGQRLRQLEEEAGRLEEELGRLRGKLEELERTVERARRWEERAKLEEELGRVLEELGALRVAPEHGELVERASRARGELEFSLLSLLDAERAAAEGLRGKGLVEEELVQQVLKRRRSAELGDLLKALWLEEESWERRWLRGLERAERHLKELQETIAQLEERERELSETIGRLAAEKDSLSKVFIDVNAGECPLCRSPLGPERARRLAEEREERLKEIELEIARAQEERKKIGEQRRRGREVQGVAERLLRAREERTKGRERLAAFLSACGELAALYGVSLSRPSECPLERAKGELERAKELSVRKRELERRLGELGLPEGRPERSRAELEAELADERKRYEELERRSRFLLGEVGRLRGSLAALREQLGELEEEIAQTEAEVKAARVKKDVYDTVSRLIEEVLGKGGLLARELTRELRGALENNANEVLKVLDRDFRVSVSEEFDIKVVRSGARGGDEKMDVRSLSGGERTMLAMALRLGLARALEVPVDFMILDEPTEFLDEEAKGKIFDIIPNLLEQLSQVIVITHDTEVEERADKVIRVTRPGTRSLVGLS